MDKQKGGKERNKKERTKRDKCVKAKKRKREIQRVRNKDTKVK
jgi:hypothetical protein